MHHDNVGGACGPRDPGDTNSCLGLWRWLLASRPAPPTAASAHGVRCGFSPLSSLEDLTLQTPDLPGHPCAAWRGEAGGPELRAVLCGHACGVAPDACWPHSAGHGGSGLCSGFPPRTAAAPSPTRAPGTRPLVRPPGPGPTGWVPGHGMTGADGSGRHPAPGPAGGRPRGTVAGRPGLSGSSQGGRRLPVCVGGARAHPQPSAPVPGRLAGTSTALAQKRATEKYILIRLGNLSPQYSLVMRRVTKSVSKQRTAFSASCLSGSCEGLPVVRVKLLFEEKENLLNNLTQV
ncbi:zinc finger protein 41 homolog isoform X1 [Meles meles]|uniref:zinc finger protein 41 homolog isoform X1 n=1 Tax=Meles meles TaxID=9662 RepID=UPI001E69E825|nr:zinc finger protein 41 homolog isoform X1 [Meles meles]